MLRKLMILLSILLLAVPAVAEDAAPEGYVAHLSTANAALMQHYGLTIPTLGLFTHTVAECGDTVIVTYESTGAVDARLTGTYFVIITENGAQPLWTHDGVDAALWQSGELTSPAWGVKQLQTYLAASNRYRFSDPYVPMLLTDLDEFEAAGGSLQWEDSENHDVAEHMRALAMEAAKAAYVMTPEDAALLAPLPGEAWMVCYPDGHNEWRVTLAYAGRPEEVLIHVSIHAETDEVLHMEISSGGVG